MTFTWGTIGHIKPIIMVSYKVLKMNLNGIKMYSIPQRVGDQMTVIVCLSFRDKPWTIPTPIRSWKDLWCYPNQKHLAIPWHPSMQRFPVFNCSLSSLVHCDLSLHLHSVVYCVRGWLTQRSMQFLKQCIKPQWLVYCQWFLKAEVIYLSAVRGHWVMKMSKAYLI